MRVRQALIANCLAAGTDKVILPALAQSQRAPVDPSEHAPNMAMSRGAMQSGKRSGGCGGMMQSVTGANGRPNSQWRAEQPGAGRSG